MILTRRYHAHRSAAGAFCAALMCLSTVTSAEVTATYEIGDGSTPPVGRLHTGETEPTFVNFVYFDPGGNVVNHAPVPLPGSISVVATVTGSGERAYSVPGTLCPVYRIENAQTIIWTSVCKLYFYASNPASCTQYGCDAGTLSFFARYGTIRGSVQYSDGSPAANVSVTATNVDGVFSQRSATSDATGALSFTCTDLACLSELISHLVTPGAVAISNPWGVPVLGDGAGYGTDNATRRLFSNSRGRSSWDLGAGRDRGFVIVEGSRESLVSITLHHPPNEDPEDEGDEPGERPPEEAEPVEPEPEEEQPEPEKPPEQEGCPVSLATGNVFLDQTDVVVPGLRHPLKLVRNYNSRGALHGHVGAFGRGWTHSYEKSVKMHRTGLIKLKKGTGIAAYFSDPDRDSNYGGLFPRLERSRITPSAGGFVRSFIQGGTEHYDANGRLARLTDRVGHETVLNRDAPSGRLLSIVEAGGRRLTFEYGFDGFVRSVSGPEGLIATYSYTGDLLSAVSYPDGSGFSFTYDYEGQLLRITDVTGRVVETHEYAGGRGLTSEIGGGQSKLTFSYGTDETVVTDALGTVTTYGLAKVNGLRRVHSVSGSCCSCGGGGGPREWTFTPEGRVQTFRNGAGKLYSYDYTADGDLRTVTDPLLRTTTYTYDAPGRTPSVLRPGGGHSVRVSGVAGPERLTSPLGAATPDPDDYTTLFAYTPSGRLERITDPVGRAKTFGYNSQGDLVRITSPLGAGTPDPDDHTLRVDYDAMGRPLLARDTLGHATAFAWDTRGRIRRVTLPDGTATEYTYDRAGRLQTVKDAAGRTTRYDYDFVGRLERVVDPAGGVTRYEYDRMSRVVGLIDAEGRRTRFERPACGQITRVIYPDNSFESFTYDLAGRLETATDRRGVVTTLVYYDDGRVQSRSYSDGTPAVSYTYDADGRLETATQGGETLSFDWDLAGQLEAESSTRTAASVGYAYYPDGRLQELRLDAAVVQSYHYDGDGRLERIEHGPRHFVFGYDSQDRRTSLSYPNGVVTSYTYDVVSRLRTLGAKLGAADVTSFVYDYDAVGNRVRKSTLSFSEDYAYDVLDRLVSVTRTGGSTGFWRYDYDKVGNRVAEQIGSDVTSWQHDVANRLQAVTGGGPMRFRGQVSEPATVTLSSVTVNGQPARMLPGNVFEAMIPTLPGTNTVTVRAMDASGNERVHTYEVGNGGRNESYAYDANGNLTQKTASDGTWTYEWTVENQLRRVLKDGVEVARFTYDPLGRRAEKTAGGATTSYAYSGIDILRETSGASTQLYIHGPAIDEPLAVKDATGTFAYFHADGLGSIVATTDAAGTVASTRQYEAFGQPETGAAGGYSFTGREWDPETGLHYYRARYYDPQVGRFISEDPIGYLGGDVNFYSYVRNNPLNWIDSFGLVPGDRFPSPDAAAKDALEYLVKQKADLRYEHGGRVCRDATGRYFCTPSQTQGHPKTVDPGHCPQGSANAGDYHNHPMSEDPDGDENYSNVDMRRNWAEGVPGYLLTPTLKMKKYVYPGPPTVLGEVKP